MANESNNAEEQLKQYAEDRRQMVPGEIHPATRNMLQGEVARTYGTAEARKRTPMRLRWLPALAWIAILAAIPLFFLPRNPETKKIQEALPAKENEVVLPTQSKPGEAPIQVSDTRTPPVDVAKVTASAAAPKPEAVASPAPSAPLRDESLARADKTAVLEQKMKAGVPVTREELAAAADRNETVLRANGRNMVSQKMETRQISATAAATPAGASASAPASASADLAANNQRLSFVNVVATPQALNNFQIEQV